MDNKLKAVIVGYGKMGRIRAQSINANPNIELLAVCDNDPKVNAPGIPVFRNYKELIRLKPDVVFVCTPNKYLPDIVCYFLNRGTHVFCEKPPGRCVLDVERMLEAEKIDYRIDNPHTFLYRHGSSTHIHDRGTRVDTFAPQRYGSLFLYYLLRRRSPISLGTVKNLYYSNRN